MKQNKTNAIDYTGPNVDYTGGSANEYINKYTNRPEDWQNTWSNVGEKIHLGLGVAGMTPGIGNIFDLLDASLYAAEGDKVGTALSLGAAIPGIGLMAGATKFAKGSKNTPNVISKVMLPSKSGKYGLEKIDEDILLKAKDRLKKELLTEESYHKWANMMKQSRMNRIQQLKDIHAPKQVIAPLQKGLDVGISKEIYNSSVLKQLETPVYKIPEDLAHQFGRDTGDALGWYSNKHNAAFIPDWTLSGPLKRNKLQLISTTLHELKHAVQAPWRSNMDQVYGDMLHGMNRDWRRKKLELTFNKKQLRDIFGNIVDTGGGVKFPLQPASSFTKYVRTPHEVSARLSEIRSGLPLDSAKRELSDAFDIRKMDWLEKNIWGVGFVPVTTTQRFEKAFGEE